MSLTAKGSAKVRAGGADLSTRFYCLLPPGAACDCLESLRGNGFETPVADASGVERLLGFSELSSVGVPHQSLSREPLPRRRASEITPSQRFWWKRIYGLRESFRTRNGS
jgi:hypothetical protein